MDRHKSRSKTLTIGVILLTLVLLVVQPSRSAFARSNSQPIPTNAAENYLLETLREGYYADLEAEFPNEADRYIGGVFFVSLLKDNQIQDQQEVAINGAIFSDYIYAYNMKIPYNIYLDNCTFLDGVDFSSADFGDVTIYDTTFEDAVYFGRIRVNGTMDLRDNTFKTGVNFYGADVENDFYISNSQILGTEPAAGTSYPSEFWTMRVGHTADFSDAIFEGETIFASSNFHTASFYRAEFDNYADFSRFTVERNVDFDDALFTVGADFSSFKAEEASFNGTMFKDDTTFDSASLETLTLDNAIFDAGADFLEINITRYADINDTQFNGDTDFSYSNI